jgi:hypothetical protein
MPQESAADRIERNLRSREADIKRLMAAHNGEPDDEYDEDSLYDFGLSVEVTRVIRHHLSTGGPADWIEGHLTADGGVLVRVTYHLADWFDHASEQVNSGPMWDLMEWHAEAERSRG